MSSIVTLIPAYKLDYLGELFLGLRSQTFKDFRVVLSDDSPGAVITEAIRSGAFDSLIDPLNLLLVRGPTLGSFQNIRFLLERWGGDAPLVHVHLDDDVIYPDFYRAHALAHIGQRAGASVSLRWLTRSDGRPTATLPLPAFIDEQAARVLSIDAERLFASTVPQCDNWLGELSNTVLSAEAAQRYRHCRMAGLSYYGLGDIGVLLDVSRHAPIALIRDHLSGFRSNPQQSSAQTQSFTLRCGFIAWVALALAAWRDGRIDEPQARQSLATTVQRCRQHHASDATMREFIAIVEHHRDDLAALHGKFAAFWSKLLATDSDSREATEPRDATSG